MDTTALRIWQYLDETLGRSGLPTAFTPQSIGIALEIEIPKVVPAMTRLWDSGVLATRPQEPTGPSLIKLPKARRSRRIPFFMWPGANGKPAILYLLQSAADYRDFLVMRRALSQHQLAEAEASLSGEEKPETVVLKNIIDQQHAAAQRIRAEIEGLNAEIAALTIEAERVPSRNREHIPKDVQREVWRRDNGRCVDCGSQEKLHFDHIIPVSKGGSNTARNIQLLCEKCNLAKGNKI